MAVTPTPVTRTGSETIAEGASEKARSIIKDLATVTVASYSGTIKVAGAANKAKLDDVLTSLEDAKNLTLDGSLELLAATRIDIDKDAVTVVKKGLTAEESEAMKGHAELVKAAQEARLAFWKFVKGLIPGL